MEVFTADVIEKIKVLKNNVLKIKSKKKLFQQMLKTNKNAWIQSDDNTELNN